MTKKIIAGINIRNNTLLREISYTKLALRFTLGSSTLKQLRYVIINHARISPIVAKNSTHFH
jgi:hypothetical protein